MRALPSGPQLKWVYDCPDFEEFNIFSDTGPGGAARLDEDNLKTADEHGVMIKNSREDRFTLLVIPEEELDLPALAATPAPQGAAQKTLVEEQAITMSRSATSATATASSASPRCARCRSRRSRSAAGRTR